MYPSKPGLLIGYHGCEESVRDDVVSGRTMLRASQNGYDWLGIGYYFWEDNYVRALDFATHPPGKRKISHPAVLGAVLDLQYCLNLMNMEHILLVRNSFDNLKASFNQANKHLPINRAVGISKDILIRELDCAVIENLHLNRKINEEEAFDSTRGLFVEGQLVYEGAGFHDKNHIQICIRNPNCIKGFFKPREDIRWLG
jgi:hypothetical protein